MTTFDKFTVHARKALSDGQHEAQQLHSALLEPEHLLLGLLCVSENTACQVMEQFHIDLQQFQQGIRLVLPQGTGDVVGEVRLAERSKRVIQFAVYEARVVNHSVLDASHLLAGILREDGHAAHLLKEQGVTLEQVQARLQATQLTQSPQLPQPPTATKDGIQKVQPQAVTLNIERQQRAKKYRRVATITGLVVNLLLIVCATIALRYIFQEFLQLNTSILYAPVFLWQPVSDWYPFRFLLIFVLTFGTFMLIMSPGLVLVNYYLPHRYKIRKVTFLKWFSLQAKSFAVIFTKLILLFEVGTLLLTTHPQSAWFWLTLIYFCYAVVMAYLSPRLLSPLYYKVTPITEPRLVQRLTQLTQKAQITVQGFYMFSLRSPRNGEGRNPVANAYMMGIGNSQRIVLTSSLARFFTNDEIEVILAHELGHQVHHDIWRILVSRTLLMAVFSYLTFQGIALLHQIAIVGSDIQSTHDATQFDLLKLMGLVLLMIAALYPYFWYRRKMERRADEYALKMTGNVVAFKNAMTRMTNFNYLPVSLSRTAQLLTTHPSMHNRLHYADMLTKDA